MVAERAATFSDESRGGLPRRSLTTPHERTRVISNGLTDADLCDVGRLRAFVRSELGDRGDVSIVGRATGGSSNVTLFIDAGDEQWVLRRPPSGDILPTAHDVVREYRYIEAVHRAGIPVAEPIAVCSDPDVIGAPFSLLRRVAGVTMSDPGSQCLASPEAARLVTRSMITVLAQLHAVDWREVGLEARSGDYLQRQVKRWSRQLELTPSAPRLGPRLAEITTWIQANVPASSRRTIVHGDYSLNNVIISPPPTAAVAAVVDWEMATVGDPMTDVVWLLRGWGRATQPSNWITNHDGALSVDEAIALYEDESGTTMENRAFYEAFCAWKGIAILEGLYAGWLSGTATNPAVAAFETTVPDAVDELYGRIACRR